MPDPSVTLNTALKFDFNQIAQQAKKAEQLFGSIKLNPNNFRPLGQITADFTQFNKSIEAANARVLAFGASAGAILGLERAFAGFVKTTINVEKQLTDINVILGANQKGLQQFGRSLYDIARNTGQSG